MELFFLCGFSLFFLFISLSFVSLFFFNHNSNASLPLPPPNYHLWRSGFLIQGAQPVEGAFVETINGCSINGWKYYWNSNSRHKIPGSIFSEGTKSFDPSPSAFEGKEYARLEMQVFMHNTRRISM